MIESAARRLAHELVNRREAINRELSRNGVRFGIYKNGEYHDRLFPYDPVPRIIESDEYDELEKGLKQRVNALNAYLKDIYSDKAIIHDGVVPEEYVYTSAGYFPQVNGVTPPGGIFAHIAGETWSKARTAAGGCWKTTCASPRVPATRCSCATSSAASPRACSATFVFAIIANTRACCAKPWTLSPPRASPWY